MNDEKESRKDEEPTLSKAEFEKSYKQPLTLNNYGSMLLAENPHFTLSLKMIDKSKPVADLGVAFGFTTKILLKNGFNVIANDLDERHLQVLWDSVSETERSQLKLKPGNVLDIEFEENSLSGVIAMRWIHFLSGDEVRKVFEKFYKWLAPGGIFMVTAVTPSSFVILPETERPKLDVESIYFERVRNGVEWPGIFKKDECLQSHSPLYSNIPEWTNLFNTDVLIRELTRAGFHIFKVEYLDRDVKNAVYYRDGLTRLETSAICIKR